MKKHRRGLVLSFLLLFITIIALTTQMALIRAQEVEDELEFGYIEGSKNGPEHWGDIKKEWAACKKGELQSPIDLINPRVAIVPKNEEILWSYKPGNATIKNRGHDIMVKWTEESSKIQINGTNYILRQCHWHTPSEHTVNGKRFDMEIHLVHESQDPKGKNKIAVFALFYKIGRPDRFLLELTRKIEHISDSEEEVYGGKIDPSDINIEGRMQYRYLGSLTTPPCTEGVIWTLNGWISTVSKKQIETLREAVHDHAEQNARPLQPLNGREVRLFGFTTQPGDRKH